MIVIDPLDVWWGLKSSPDGRSEGYPVTGLGGLHADLPLGEGDGRAVADFPVENPVPALLALRLLGKSAQRRLVADFAEQFAASRPAWSARSRAGCGRGESAASA